MISIGENPALSFRFFYLLAFAVSFVIIIIAGKSRGYSLRAILLTMALSSALAIIGSRLFTIPFETWPRVFLKGDLGNFQNRSAVGAMLFALAGLFFSQWFFSFKKSIIDLYAWAAPIGFGIQKFGCFANGCCYGRTTGLPWAVHYSTGSQAHFHQWTAGIITDTDALTTGLQPVQLYESLFLFAIAYIVWHSRKRWKKPGSMLLLSLALFFTFRFITEFARDPSTCIIMPGVKYGLRTFQWLMATLAALNYALLTWHERSRITRIHVKIEPRLFSTVIFITSVSLMVYFFRQLFSRTELMAFYTRFIPAVLLTIWYVYTEVTVRQFRLVTSFFLIIPFFLMAQTIQTDSSGTTGYHRLESGFSFGKMYSDLEYNPQAGACGTTYTHEDYRHEYRMGGLGYSRVIFENNSKSTLGVRVYAGREKEYNLTRDFTNTYTLWGINPYVNYDFKWVGMGVGIHAGNLRWIPSESIAKEEVETGTRFSEILPQGYLRVGPSRIADLEFEYAKSFPSPLPVNLYSFRLGTSFGLSEDYHFSFGLNEPRDVVMINGKFPLDDHFGLDMSYFFGKDYTNYVTPLRSPARLMFSLNYTFGDHRRYNNNSQNQ
ncbi:MAG TPA: prolipoprotein diacylglyceryl transferase family protein [Bacteroidales bacterium]|nr:prolipoprotein diacylglyceryl transferase family protein [Bacteroidales bacterium]